MRGAVRRAVSSLLAVFFQRHRPRLSEGRAFDLFSDARLYFVSVVSREFDREIRVSSNKKQTPVERSTDARYR
jgi:hypothetical protein